MVPCRKVIVNPIKFMYEQSMSELSVKGEFFLPFRVV